MYSIGDLIDKLIVENVKIAFMKQELNTKKKGDAEYNTIYQKMMVCNKNRAIIIGFLDDKIKRVIDGKEPNQLLGVVKTYR